MPPVTYAVPSDLLDQAPGALTEQPLRFRLLGNIEVHHDDGRPVGIRGTIQLTLLAALLAADCRMVSVQALVDELWAENPPATAENSLQAHISRLRRKLHGPGNAGHAQLLSLSAGYRLLVDRSEVDGHLFQLITEDVRNDPHRDPDTAATLLRHAMALWRGPVFGGLVGGPICQGASARYQASWNMAVENLYDIELRRGRHSQIIPELSALVESPALNERVCEQLMVALYRSGQQTYALEVFHRMRQRLDEELGVAPSPTLYRLESAILNHSQVLRCGGDHRTLRA